jgi:hypothetical protein
MQVIKVVKECVKNVSVMTDTGIKVKVPVELGRVGIELDDLRVYQMPNGKYRYLSLNSRLYKRMYAEKFSFQLKDEDWFEFNRLSKWYIRKFVKRGWIRYRQFNEWLDEWTDYAFKSGVHFRLAQMDSQHGHRYMYSHIKGFLYRSIKKKVEEPEPVMVSFEVLESRYII